MDICSLPERVQLAFSSTLYGDVMLCEKQRFPVPAIFLIALLPAAVASVAFASEIRITGDRVVITSDDGTVIDTANPPKGQEVKAEGDIEINENGVSIGSVTNSGGEQKNIHRSTKVENVTIINNSKTTTYRKDDKNQEREGKGKEEE